MVGLNINAEVKKQKNLWISTANKIKALLLWHPTIMGDALRMDFHFKQKKEKMIWNR